MAKQFAIRLSLIVFAAAVIEALVKGDEFATGIINGGLAAACGFGIGLIVGEIARRIIEENAAAEFGLNEIVAPPMVEQK